MLQHGDRRRHDIRLIVTDTTQSAAQQHTSSFLQIRLVHQALGFCSSFSRQRCLVNQPLHFVFGLTLFWCNIVFQDSAFANVFDSSVFSTDYASAHVVTVDHALQLSTYIVIPVVTAMVSWLLLQQFVATIADVATMLCSGC